MNVRKAMGFTKDRWSELKFLVTTTRESLRPNIAGMRWKPRTDEYVIIITDRTGLAHKVFAMSKDLGGRERQIKIYHALLQELGLPHHCDQCKFAVTGEAAFFDDEDDDEGWDTTWGDDDEDEGWDTEDIDDVW